MSLNFNGIVWCNGTENGVLADALEAYFMRSNEERGVVVIDDVAVDIVIASVSRSASAMIGVVRLRIDLICVEV